MLTGRQLGAALGAIEGLVVGEADGRTVGDADGREEGWLVGLLVG